MPAPSSNARTRTSTGPRTPDATASSSSEPRAVLTLGAPDRALHACVADLLARYRLTLTPVADGETIPGSYWGDSEAGLEGARVYARRDTPVHSVLHESCHAICMDPSRRAGLDTDAGGSDLEECGVCYLSILLADTIPGFGRERMLRDMDAWGYSFRLGSARAWFEHDAADARAWLRGHALIDAGGRPTLRRRGEDEAAGG